MWTPHGVHMPYIGYTGELRRRFMYEELQSPIFNIREVSITQAIEYVTHVRALVGADCNKIDPALYWRMCAINEISELAMHYSWEVWKKSPEGVDYISARQEAVDVIAFLIAAVNTQGMSNLNYINSKMITYWDQHLPQFKIDGCHLMVLGEAPEAKFHECGYRIIKYIQSRELAEYGYNSTQFMDVITILCQLTHMNKDTLIAHMIGKLTLVACRLENGIYHRDWNKVSETGVTETEFLFTLIRAWQSDETNTINQLIKDICDHSSVFRY